MITHAVIRENWLTRKPHGQAFSLMLLLGFGLFFAGMSYIFQFQDVHRWMVATQDLVFHQHQYWRAWTTLLAHGDMSHLLSNAMLFLPLCYLLTGYFSLWFFPIMAFAMGGLINFVVLSTLPPETALVGISGMVYWMGASWLTLYILIERRESLRKRLAIALFLSLMLFVPETYKPEISYLSHFVGFLLGICTSTLYYWMERRKFLSAEVIEWVNEDEEWPEATAL